MSLLRKPVQVLLIVKRNLPERVLQIISKRFVGGEGGGEEGGGATISFFKDLKKAI